MTHAEIAIWHGDLEGTPYPANRALAVLSAMFSAAARRSVISKLPANRTRVKANLEGFSDEEIFARVEAMVAGVAAADEAEDPKVAEFHLLASAKPLIGENRPGAHLHAETLERTVLDPEGDAALSGIDVLVAVHRLREVGCLYGFTRFEPAPLATDDLEDVGLAVSGAPLGQSPDWLPAVEQYGEGFFMLFSPDALARWLAKADVLARAQGLQAGASAWIQAKRARGMAVSEGALQERERPEYVMAHSLAHALMTEGAIDCGYPASALKERIYVLPRVPGQPIRCGLLIYTATAGNQGTLGGLVEVTSRRGPDAPRGRLPRLLADLGDEL